MSLTTVSESLLTSNDLHHQHLQDVLQSLAERHLDYADLYFQSSCHEAWGLEDGIIKRGSYNIDQGVGIRAIRDDKTGFAYADQITLQALQQSANAARSIVNQAGKGKACLISKVNFKHLYSAIDPIQTMSPEEKIALLQRVNAN